MKRDELARNLDQLLDASRVRDYCPNALGEHLARTFGLRHRFIDIAGPVSPGAAPRAGTLQFRAPRFIVFLQRLTRENFQSSAAFGYNPPAFPPAPSKERITEPLPS